MEGYIMNPTWRLDRVFSLECGSSPGVFGKQGLAHTCLTRWEQRHPTFSLWLVNAFGASSKELLTLSATCPGLHFILIAPCSMHFWKPCDVKGMVESFFSGISPYFPPLWGIWNMKTSDLEILYLAYLWNYTFSLTHIIWKKTNTTKHQPQTWESQDILYWGKC